MSNVVRIALGLWLAVVAASCGEKSPSPGSGPAGTGAAPATQASSPVSLGAAGGRPAARYGGETLTGDELAIELLRLPERSRRTMTADSRTKFVENHVLNELLFAQGLRDGYGDDAEIQRQVDDLRKRLIVQKLVRKLQDLPAVTDDQVKQYYDGNPQKFSTATIKARHILVKDEGKANELHAQVKADPGKFAEIAQVSSADTASARKGGDLGFFGRGRMVPEFESVAFALRAGELSGVVKTPYGYHIILVEEVREGSAKPFDTVKEQIRATLRSEALQKRTKDYYEDLKGKGKVEIDAVVIEEVATKLAEAAPAAPDLPRGHPVLGHGRPPAGDGAGDMGAGAGSAAGGSAGAGTAGGAKGGAGGGSPAAGTAAGAEEDDGHGH